MNWPFNPIQPQLMQTTRGNGVHTRRLHKHKHVLTFTAVIEVEAWNLGETEWARFPEGRLGCVCAGTNGDHVWFEACSGHYSWRVDKSHLILLPYCNNKPLHLFGKGWIECSGRHSPSWNYIPDAEGISPAWYAQIWKPLVMKVPCGHIWPPRSSTYNVPKWSQMNRKIDNIKC